MELLTDVTKSAGIERRLPMGHWSGVLATYDGGWLGRSLRFALCGFSLGQLYRHSDRARTCKYMGIDVQCGPPWLKGIARNSISQTIETGNVLPIVTQNEIWNRKYGASLWTYGNSGRTLTMDGKLDLLFTNDGQPKTALYQGDGAGTFTNIGISSGVALSDDGAEQANMGVALGDYLHTGHHVSLHFLTSITEYGTLYRNDGGRGGIYGLKSNCFGDCKGLTRGYVGMGRCLVDFDNDGWAGSFFPRQRAWCYSPQVDSNSSGLKYREPADAVLGTQADGNIQGHQQNW